MAAKFRFPLQSVLDHRQRIENQRRRELAEVEARRQACYDSLRSMQQSILGARHGLGSGLRGRVDMAQVSGFARYSMEARAEAQQIVQRLAVIERDVERAREQLADAARQRKALELLRDKQLAEWHQRQDRREAAELDEIGMQLYVRQQQSRRAGSEPHA